MRVMNVRSIKLEFSLDVVVTVVFWANFMNEQIQNIRQRNFYSNSKKLIQKTIHKTLSG